MGATTFTAYALGTDAKAAFHTAVEEARYNYGSSGYTGTVAEKETFVLITATPLPWPDAEKLAAELIEAEDPRIADEWGPAGAIAVTEPPGKGAPTARHGWLFFGWASN